MTGSRRLDPAPVQQVDQLATQFGQLAFGNSLDRTSPRHWPVARLKYELNSSIRGKPTRRASQHIRKFLLERSEGGMIRALEVHRGIDEAQRGQVELCPIGETFRAGCKADRGRGWKAAHRARRARAAASRRAISALPKGSWSLEKPLWSVGGGPTGGPGWAGSGAEESGSDAGTTRRSMRLNSA